MEGAKAELETEKNMHARTREQLAAERQAAARVREDCDHQVAKMMQVKESIDLQDQHQAQQLKKLQQETADLRRQLAAKQDEKNAVEVEVEELRRTLLDRSNDSHKELANVEALQVQLLEIEAERRRWREERAQLLRASSEDNTEQRRRVEQAEGKVLVLEQSLAVLVNEKRLWEVERNELHQSMIQIENKYQEERLALEHKVQEIESAFDQVVLLIITHSGCTHYILRFSLNKSRIAYCLPWSRRSSSRCGGARRIACRSTRAAVAVAAAPTR